MAKNYVEDGKTIEIVATTSPKSGDLAQVWRYVRWLLPPILLLERFRAGIAEGIQYTKTDNRGYASEKSVSEAG